jgi:hypothetical protein
MESMKLKDRVTKPWPFARFFARFKKVPVGNVDNKDIAKGPVDSEERADLKDSLAPIYDELKLNWLWRIPEYICFKRPHQEGDKTLQPRPQVRKMNRKVGRNIPIYQGKDGDVVRVHRSVKTRMDARYPNGDKYLPNVVNLGEGRAVWVK